MADARLSPINYTCLSSISISFSIWEVILIGVPVNDATEWCGLLLANQTGIFE